MNTSTRPSLLIILLATLSVIVGGLLLKNKPNNYSELDEAKNIGARLEKQLELVNQSTVPIVDYLANHDLITFGELNQFETIYPFYIFKKGVLTYWSTHEYVPKYVDVLGDQEYKYLETRKGKFLEIKTDIIDTGYELIILIPLYFNSLIENQYLFSKINSDVFESNDINISAFKKNESQPICLINQDCLFNVDFGSTYFNGNHKYKSEALLLVYFGLLLYIGLIFKFSYSLRKFKNGWLSIITLIVLIGVLRTAMLIFDWQINAFDSTFFNPQVFASSYLTPTLADLLINIALLLGILFFVLKIISSKSPVNLSQNNIISILLGLINGAGLWQLFLLIETVYYNSNYTLDITSSIEFSKERILVFIVVILSSALFIVFGHIIYMAYKKYVPIKNSLKQQLLFIIGTIIFGLIIHLIGQSNWTVVVLSIVYSIILEKSALPDNSNNVSYQSFTYLLVGIIFSSLLFSLNVKEMEEEREQINKVRFANQFLIGNDELAEYLLLETSNSISNDAFIKSRMFSPFLSKEVIKEKVKRVFLSNYFDKYDVDVLLYNNKGDSYDADLNDSLEELRKKYDAKPLGNANEFYLINNYQGEYTKGYVSVTEIRNYGVSAGYVAITLKLKKIIPDNVYPDLLVDSRFLLPFENKNYSYAIYAGKTPIYSSGEFNYERNFELERFSGNVYKNHGYNHTILEESEGRKIIVSTNEYNYFDVFSNFSFLVLLMIFVVVVLLLVYGGYFFISGKSLNYSARIQLYFNWAFFLPLIAISTVTLSLITEGYQEEVEYEHHKKAMVIGRNIENEVGEGLQLRGEELENQLKLASTMANTDANLFDTKGRLKASSQPLIYKKNVLSEFMPPLALSEIVEQANHSFTAKESVGELVYNTTYIGIKSPISGELLAVLSVPYFQSEFNLEKEKIEVFITIVNVFVIVFVVFLTISYFASKWLTFPLRFITEKLKDTKLSEVNKPLKWESNDEIGLMVSEYNKMIVNLDESKKALARTEKETAWRKIAQQVAHEIKNPLTPMKLTLQHLQRTLLGDKINQGFDKPVKSLLQQVDTLSDIVTSFSSFAQMPIPEHERYEITDLIRQTITLHKREIKILEDLPTEKIYSMGDVKLMGRIILNMILNAEQSSGEEVTISISLRILDEKKLLLEIKDDGEGIPEEIVEKIFIPNFTTKETGSGIGLAIAKHGIEHAGGEIWFETKVGVGTSFFIELPRVK